VVHAPVLVLPSTAVMSLLALATLATSFVVYFDALERHHDLEAALWALGVGFGGVLVVAVPAQPGWLEPLVGPVVVALYAVRSRVLAE